MTHDGEKIRLCRFRPGQLVHDTLQFLRAATNDLLYFGPGLLLPMEVRSCRRADPKVMEMPRRAARTVPMMMNHPFPGPANVSFSRAVDPPPARVASTERSSLLTLCTSDNCTSPRWRRMSPKQDGNSNTDRKISSNDPLSFGGGCHWSLAHSGFREDRRDNGPMKTHRGMTFFRQADVSPKKGRIAIRKSKIGQRPLLALITWGSQAARPGVRTDAAVPADEQRPAASVCITSPDEGRGIA